MTIDLRRTPAEEGRPGGGGPGRRSRRRLEPLAVTAWALMANTVTTSALGVVFWAVASQLYTPHQLGEDAALLSAMILLSTVSQLNLGMGIPRLLPQVQHHRWRPVAGAYALTAVVGSILAGGFIVVAPRLSDGFAFLADDTGLALALLGGVVLWNIFALQDAVLTSARWAAAIPVENGLFGLLKIGAMVWLARSAATHGVFLGWLAAMGLLLLPVNGLIFSRVLPSTGGTRTHPLPTVVPLAERRVVTRYLATDYLAALLSQGSSALLPLLVVGVLGQAENAYFYVAFLIVGAVAALAQSLSTSLLVEGAHDEANMVALARRSVRRYLSLIAPAVVVLVAAAPLVLRPFGAAYAENGTTLLRLLLAGTVPQAVVVLYLGVERVRARVSRVLAAEAATVVLVTVGAILGMRWYGLAGLGLAWLVAQVAVAAAVAPRLWRALTRPDEGGGAEEPVAATDQRTSRDRTVPPAPPEPFPTTVDVVDMAAAFGTALLLVVVGLGITGPPRVVLALAFVSFVPGWALLDHLPVRRDAGTLAVAVGLSLSLSTLTTVLVLWLQLWEPRALLDAAGSVCLAAIVWHLAQPRGGSVADAAPSPSWSRPWQLRP